MDDKETESAPNPVGRPTDYRPEYCNVAMRLGREGKSKAQLAAFIGVTRKTLDNWTESHTEFLHAMELSRDFALAWWEDTGQSGLPAGVLNASLWSRSMAARFPADYREEHAITGPGGGPITTRDETPGLNGVKAALAGMLIRSAKPDNESG
jgi:hypothetical protein